MDKKATAAQLMCSAMRERKTQKPRHTGTAYKSAAKRAGTWSESQYSTVWRMLSSMVSRYFGPYSMCPCAQLLPAPYYSPGASHGKSAIATRRIRRHSGGVHGQLDHTDLI